MPDDQQYFDGRPDSQSIRDAWLKLLTLCARRVAEDLRNRFVPGPAGLPSASMKRPQE